MKFIITVDTEEDGWGDFRAREIPVTNIDRIPELQRLFDEYLARPTYLITYPVATSDSSKRILREIQDSDRAEIGSHCHPWNTPPIDEDLSARSSMLCNLPVALQFKKLETLTEAIQKEFGRRPVSFRAGRWAISGEVAANVSSLGYRVDTSVTPYQDWSHEHGPDFLGISYGDGCQSISEVLPTAPSGLVEIPPSIGFTQRHFGVAAWAYRTLTRSPIAKSARLYGLCSRLGLVEPRLALTRAPDCRGAARSGQAARRSAVPASST